MLQYVQYMVAWLFFMALIAVITLLVPKLAKPVEKWIAERRARSEKEKAQPAPPEAEEKQNRD